MMKIKYTSMLPDTDFPILYAKNYASNPTFVKQEMENGVMVLYYSLPHKEYWSLRTIKHLVPGFTLYTIAKYLYSFNYYQLRPESRRKAYKKVKMILP